MNAPDQISTIEDDRVAKRNVIRLAFAQALAGANSVVIMTTGAIVGSILAPSAVLATVPVSVYVVGTALSTLPAGAIARRYGRNRAFVLGTGAGVLFSLFAAFAIYVGSFGLFCLATFISGFYQAVAQSLRFAATDTASPAFRTKALSWVMVGGVFAGVLGPQLVTVTIDLWPPYPVRGELRAPAVVALVAMCVLAGATFPSPAPPGREGRRPARRDHPGSRRSWWGSCAAWCPIRLMNLVMTSAPLAMKMCGLSLSAAERGIQWHVVAMSLPSFFTGAADPRFGAPRVVPAGSSAGRVGSSALN